jgi:predicted DsbA family dithiol-disulfide isomerase
MAGVATRLEGVRSERALARRAATLSITEFSDPGCPWAWSAEPARRRLDWLYGEAIDWSLRMVVLSERPEDYLEKGFTPERLAEGSAQIAREHRMPIDTRLRPRMHATLPACRAVVATRVYAPERARAIFRQLQIRNFSGQLLDEPDTILGAAADAGIDSDDLFAWARDPVVLEQVEEDKRLARGPSPAALALDHKLAGWDRGRRYTCPSYEVARRSDGVRLSAPGFQPFGTYEVIAANLAPELERRPAPSSVEEVLRWAGEPLATAEVAAVCDIPFDEAREELGRVADERHIGADGLWSLPAAG